MIVRLALTRDKWGNQMRVGRVLSAGFAAVFVVACAALLTSWPPFSFRSASLFEMSDDIAFILTSAALLHQHAQWGVDAVFTYGPLEFLSTWPLYPEQILPFLVYRLAFALALGGLICAIIWTFISHWAWRSIAILIFGANAYLWFIGWPEGLWLAPAIAIAVLQLEDRQRRSTGATILCWIGAILLGPAALVKFSFTVTYAAIFVLIACRDVWRGRLPILTLVFSASVIVAWMIAGQNIQNLATWLFASAELSGGYSNAMSKGFWVPYSAPVVLSTYLAGILLVAIPIVTDIKFYEKLYLVALCILLAAINIQHSFGGNQIEISTIALIFPAIALAVALQRRAALVATAAIAVCCGILAVTNFSVANFLNAPNWIPSHIDHASRAFSGTYDFAGKGLQNYNADVRALADLPSGMKGTADAYPRKSGVIIANPNLIYQPRPAFLSLNAHTERLALLNAAFLRSERAPDWILFELNSGERVNNRYPATDDGPSWPEIWSRYDSIGQRAGLQIYQRRAIPRQWSLEQISKLRLPFSQDISIPDAGLIWAKVDAQTSWLGRLVSVLYKSPHIQLRILCDDGSTKTFQIVPELGRAGFLLSPFVSNTKDFADQKGPRIVSATFQIEGNNNWFFKPEFELVLSRIVN